ncbi:MAG: sulfite exporter TauE/SafE family protein [Nitrospirae bacterium]|nr:sulfite exporter TauE/SafE family protein [Nitrospirota bacterium]
MSTVDLVLVGLAAILGGAVNALAGGGTLITFPVLTAVGVPAVAANITNTLALCPGYLGATFAQMKELRGQLLRLGLLIPVSLIGGIVGGVLLLKTGEHAFRKLVPFLILMAVVLLAFQDKLRAWVLSRSGHTGAVTIHDAWVMLPVIPAAVYGGYFGAGVSVIVLAVLGLVLEESFTRLNALKQAVSFSINIAAAIFFLFSGKVVWSAAIVMAVCALAGGVLGGRLAGWIRPSTLRRIVVVTGVVVTVIYFVG